MSGARLARPPWRHRSRAGFGAHVRVLTWPLLAVTILMLGRGWYLEMAHRGRWRSPWRRRASLVLIASTALAVVLWGLRFTGLLGMKPF